jgi:DEAD/DEAH box helicase domain-containing protein
MTNLNNLINILKKSEYSHNITKWVTVASINAELSSFPENLNKVLQNALMDYGITQLYSHQNEAFKLISEGKNLIISTGTASGKTYCYNLSVLNAIIEDADTTALYLFPTKALTSDQLKKIQELNAKLRFDTGKYSLLSPIIPAIYDGDTSVNERNHVRNRANIILTNPDMLHVGILPHHTIWERIFRKLKFVIIDEIHIYRGVFGSHLANVIRRLKRITQFYGANPQFIMTSATIANAKDFAEKLIEESVSLIDKDGSAYGKRNTILYNPPIINQDLGLRNGIISESVKIAGDILANHIQTIFFARSRKTVEITLKNLRSQYEQNAEMMHGYRSGYLAKERRQIENGLRDGSIRAVVSTNALELGIDMGSMEAIVMMGYPGTIAAFRQQSGRAGRMKSDSIAFLIASSTPLDQFIIKHPEYLLEGSPENALINPNNPLILLAHLKCALFELPLMEGDHFGSLAWEEIKPYLQFLVTSEEAYMRSSRYLWMKDAYPANQISLRSASAQPILLVSNNNEINKTIGEVDRESANWMVHPGAIYLHEGISYLVNKLNFMDHVAELSLTDVDYITEPKNEIDIQKINELKFEKKQNSQKCLGEILVTSKVTGFQKLRWISREVLGNETLELPPTELRTVAYWLTLSPVLVNELREKNLWKNDQNIYGSDWNDIRPLVRKRDHYHCQICGIEESGHEHHVHHKIPFRAFSDVKQANQLDNLITLCPNCHHRTEQSVRIRSGLSGLCYVISHLAPLILMCDEKDLGSFNDPQAKFADMQPSVIIYDQFPGGIGLSESLFKHDDKLIRNAIELIKQCACTDGCPSCVGPAGENGVGGKEPTLAILELLQL